MAKLLGALLVFAVVVGVFYIADWSSPRTILASVTGTLCTVLLFVLQLFLFRPKSKALLIVVLAGAGLAGGLIFGVLSDSNLLIAAMAGAAMAGSLPWLIRFEEWARRQ